MEFQLKYGIVFFIGMFVFNSAELRCQSFLKETTTEVFTADTLYFPSDIAFVDGWLFIREEFFDYEIKVYNGKTGNKEYEFGRKGRGPAEYLTYTIQRGPGNNTLEISDTANRKNDVYDVGCLKRKPRESELHKCILSSTPNAASRQALVLNEDLIVNHGSNFEGVVYLSVKEKISEFIDTIPEEVNDLFNRPIQGAMAMTGKIAGNSERNRFAYFADSFDRAVFYYREGDEVALLKEHEYSFLPEFDLTDYGSSSVLRPSEKYRGAFYSPVAGSKHYFVLYSGKTAADVEMKEGAEWRASSNIIKVFTWEGEEVSEIRLDRDLFMLAVNEEETKIFGIHLDKDLHVSVVSAEIK